MDLSSLKGDKWKIISMILIGVFILVLIGSFLLQESRHSMQREGRLVELRQDEMDRAIEIAVLTLEDRITEDYLPTVRDKGFQVETEFQETHSMATVSFSSDSSDIVFRVVVDLDDGKAITIIEHRGSMTGRGRPPII